MTTLVLQPDAAAGMDTEGDTNLPDSTHGADPQFHVGDNNAIAMIWHTFIKFDLSTIPADVHIDTATLTLKIMGDWSNNARTFRVYRMIRAWTEAGVSWNHYGAGAGEHWTVPGGFDAPECELTDIGSHAFTAAEAIDSTHDFVLSAWAIQQMITGGGWTNNGFMIKADTEIDDAYGFYSSDHGTAGNRPMLTITWSPVLGRLPKYIVDGLQGGITLKATVEQFANETWVRHTPVGGALTRTPAAHSIDAASQAKFGRKDQPLQGGSSSVTIADQISDTY
ncbi:MAG: DNRLRE domain-containing protein, partial [Dehalococcoidia bacterium]|nr:DNRLRE domain-containing protein [Dehalococcoidia bacterium]